MPIENNEGAQRARIDNVLNSSDFDSNYDAMNNAVSNKMLKLQLSDDENQNITFINNDLTGVVARDAIKKFLEETTAMPHIKQLLYGDEKLEWSEWSRYFKRKLVSALFSEYSQRFPNSNARPSRADAVALRKELASQFPNKFGLGQIWNKKLHKHAYEPNKGGLKDNQFFSIDRLITALRTSPFLE